MSGIERTSRQRNHKHKVNMRIGLSINEFGNKTAAVNIVKGRKVVEIWKILYIHTVKVA